MTITLIEFIHLPDPYSVHVLLSRCFDKLGHGQQRTASGGFLWREDDGVIRVGSQVAPNWNALPTGAVKLAEATVPDVKPGFFNFSLHANPTFQRSKGRRVSHPRPLEWLAKKGEGSGFQIVSAQLTHRYVRKVGKNRTSPIPVDVCKFEGVLEVVDPEQFTTAVCTGIGPAKPFGCGFMLTSPAR